LSNPAITVEDLTKSYGDVVAVDGLSLEVEEGGITGLIGPNGAGKTTTIKIILGLLRPDRGEITVLGEKPWDNPEMKRRVGVVNEKAYFPSNHKVLDYLERVCRIHEVKESRAKEVLELVDLREAWDRPIGGLSAGMLQKFSIAHALVHAPRVVVADEPTSNLDPQARSGVLDALLMLNKQEDVTILISSHILPELSKVCESVAIVNQGKVWASGVLDELYERFGASTMRISTDNPEALAKEISSLDYVVSTELAGTGVSVTTATGEEERLYEDVPKLARGVGAKVRGLESRSASLEELFRLAVEGEQ
jgi:ABC-2 type transport system ATP-binding protein